MIIAWYPGGGGNRFYNYLQGQTDFEVNKKYDQQNPYQTHINRYPTHQKQVVQHPIVFTHCVNYNLITDCWPGHDKIYFISTSRSKSLRRQWKLFQQFLSQNQHPAGGPFSTICWHDEYYTAYPWDTGLGITVDDINFPNFLKMIQQELDSIVCPEFDFAQQIFDQYGPHASILDLYNHHYDNQ